MHLISPYTIYQRIFSLPYSCAILLRDLKTYCHGVLNGRRVNFVLVCV